MKISTSSIRVPIFDPFRGPHGRFFSVAILTRIRRTDRDRQIGSRHSKTMVSTRIDNHICLRAHVAIHALGTGTPDNMTMMVRSIENTRYMALPAKRITVGTQLHAMRIMTIAAAHARLMHRGLEKGSVNIDLIENLTVRMIEIGIE